MWVSDCITYSQRGWRRQCSFHDTHDSCGFVRNLSVEIICLLQHSPWLSIHLGSVFTLFQYSSWFVFNLLCFHLGSVFILVCIHLVMHSPWLVFTLACIHLGLYSHWLCIHLGLCSPWHVQVQIQNRWPETVNSQSVYSQSVDSQACLGPDPKSVARDSRLPECRLPECRLPGMCRSRSKIGGPRQ